MEISYNIKPQASEKESPLFLQIGYNPTSIPTAFLITNISATQEQLLSLQKAREEANAVYKLARQKND